MSTKSIKKQEVITEKKSIENGTAKPFNFRYPFIYLSAIVVLLYIGSLNFGFTELDDTIFVNDYKAYNSELSNIAHSFHRGVFDETKDTYYRPLLMVSFIVNNWISDTNIKGYHAINLLFHLLSVFLLFIFFKKMEMQKNMAFLLTALFAVHPVLSQAVAWIPGRNDTLMAVFILGFMIASIEFLQKEKYTFLLLQGLFLLCALFTKETALFVPPAFLFLLSTTTFFNWKNKRSIIMYGMWSVAAIIWFIARSSATIKNDPIQFASMAKSFVVRFPLAIQYLGKIILPFNLSVFPMMADTSYIFGFAAIAVLVALLYFSTERKMKIVFAGLAWFIFLLIPLFVLPSVLNDQDFEHRLYLPIIGILFILSQTVLFKDEKKSIIIVSILAVCFAGINYVHQQKFADTLTFWTDAVRTTPNSSYANMMLGARTKDDMQKATAYMHKAYELNPKEKYVNYYLGKYYLDNNDIDKAEKYLTAELKGSAYYDTYFCMSRLSFLKKDTTKCINYMETYLEKDGANGPAINNYILMLAQTNQKEKARQFIAKKRSENIPISQELSDVVK